MPELLLGSETYKIVGICMAVHRELGFGFSEVIYKDAIQIEAEQEGIPLQREKQLDIYYKGRKIAHRFFVDFVMYDNIITEIKCSSEGIAPEHINQTLNYMKAANTGLGLVVNFGHKLEFKRVIL